MKIITTIKQMRKALTAARRRGERIGFVPTMGALHEGHLALLRRCKKENDIAVLSIFVNPTQFGPKEDYRTYPRTWKDDARKARVAGADYLFHPAVREMYPDGFATFVAVDPALTNVLCGESRPGHFRGVATVVAKLLNIVTPDTAYFGQKDAQQCAVISRMVRDLDIPAAVKIHPTVRESDGLAMSSRNQYLTPQERREAVVLYQALCLGKKIIARGERTAGQVIKAMRRHIQAHSSGKIDYVSCVDPGTLQPFKIIKHKALLAVAVRFEKARLIDNIIVPTYNA